MRQRRLNLVQMPLNGDAGIASHTNARTQLNLIPLVGNRCIRCSGVLHDVMLTRGSGRGYPPSFSVCLRLSLALALTVSVSKIVTSNRQGDLCEPAKVITIGTRPIREVDRSSSQGGICLENRFCFYVYRLPSSLLRSILGKNWSLEYWAVRKWRTNECRKRG